MLIEDRKTSEHMLLFGSFLFRDHLFSPNTLMDVVRVSASSYQLGFDILQ